MVSIIFVHVNYNIVWPRNNTKGLFAKYRNIRVLINHSITTVWLDKNDI